MKNWVNDEGIPGECPWEQDIQDALAVAKTTGIEFRVIDLVDEYRARIVNYLIEGYRAGYTPNPDVLCNREMKFGVFLDYALESGVRLRRHRPLRPAGWTRAKGLSSCAGRDPNKDQSYFLSLMRPDQIARARLSPWGSAETGSARSCGKIRPPHGTQERQPGHLFHRPGKNERFPAPLPAGQARQNRGHGRPDARHAQRPASVHHGPEERARRRLPRGRESPMWWWERMSSATA